MTATLPTAAFPTSSVILTPPESGDVVVDLNPARFIVDRERGNTQYRFYQSVDESIVYEVNMTRLLAQRGTTLASVGFSVYSGNVALGLGQLTGGKARIDTRMDGNKGTIRMLAVQADGNTRVIYISLRAR
jgi:hypothetical protein